MSQSKHTPGPWEVDEERAAVGWWPIRANDATVICRVECDHSDDEALPVAHADARLIAAAPDLAAACEAAVTRIHTGEGHVRDLSECRDGACKLLFAALQKAGLR